MRVSKYKNILLLIDITGGPVPDEYQFLQFHMHWGSNDLEGAEHVIDGVRLPGEVR
jgi:carbonic anhydrase